MFWAPAYMLPGYLTGEDSYFLATQSLAMRTLTLLLVSALAILIALLAIYHHLHPEHPRMARWVPALQHLPERFPFLPAGRRYRHRVRHYSPYSPLVP